MDNEKFQELVLQQLKSLTEGQSRLEDRMSRLEATQQKQGHDILTIKKDVKELKSEVRYVWDDIKKLDTRLTAQGEELVIMKRLK
jgi:uncharacterized coiled-coil protein SlyX